MCCPNRSHAVGCVGFQTLRTGCDPQSLFFLPRECGGCPLHLSPLPTPHRVVHGRRRDVVEVPRSWQGQGRRQPDGGMQQPGSLEKQGHSAKTAIPIECWHSFNSVISGWPARLQRGGLKGECVPATAPSVAVTRRRPGWTENRHVTPPRDARSIPRGVTDLCRSDTRSCRCRRTVASW